MVLFARTPVVASSVLLLLAACPGDDSATTDSNADTEMGTTVVAPASTSDQPASSSDDGAEDSSSGGNGVTSTTSATGSVDSSSGAADDNTTNGEVAVCGNNVREGDEVCDLAQLGGATCQSLGYQGGQLGCLLTCDDYNLLGCFICGNEVVDIAEDCEGSVPEEVTCESLGYQAGEITCGDDCLYDLSECSICGDGVQQGPESCDGIDLGGETCASLGFMMGNLGCNVATCSYNYAGCSGGQYIQNFEGGVMPGEFTASGNLGWTVDTNAPIAGMYSAHSGAITHNQQSNMNLNVAFAAAGEVHFFRKTDTEACCDHLRFFVDGVQVGTWSGNNPSLEIIQPIAAGMHTFQWRYIKDGSVNTGADRVWVDDITLVGGVPM